MNILIGGGTGFIGQALVKHLRAQDHQVTVISRHKHSDDPTIITWDELTIELIELQQVVINLTGVGIGDRTWTDKRKKEILDSRVIPTETLSNLCAESINKPALFVASAIGIYGLQQSETNSLPPDLDESTVIDFKDESLFSATVCKRVESAAKRASHVGVRVVDCRFGVVLDESGGALKKLKTPYLFGLGGPIGNGMQPFCWVALNDVVNAIEFLIKHEDISGPVNIVSPNTVTQKEFAHTFAHHLHRPAILPTPAFVIKLIFGQMGEELLLQGQHVFPTVLLDHGFEFQHPHLEDALKEKLS